MSHQFPLPPERSIPESRAAFRQAALEEHVSRGSARSFFARLPSRFAVTAVAAPVLVFAGAAMTYNALQPASVPVSQETRCYTDTWLDGGDTFHGTTVGQATASDGHTAATAAVETCSALWRQGFLTTGATSIAEPPSQGMVTLPVPGLVACTLKNGVAAVLPGDSGTCARLGLPRLQE